MSSRRRASPSLGVVRKAFIAEALAGVRQLTAVIKELTAPEIEHAIELEEATRRRDTILNKLYRQRRALAKKQFQRSTHPQ